MLTPMDDGTINAHPCTITRPHRGMLRFDVCVVCKHMLGCSPSRNSGADEGWEWHRDHRLGAP